MKASVGDKVRLKTGVHAGVRGIIKAINAKKLAIGLEGIGIVVSLPADEVLNYSLAARKAWATEPNRAVGRRKGTKLCDRVSVTLRIDRQLWHQFMSLENEGVIEDRTGWINKWLRDELLKLTAGGV